MSSDFTRSAGSVGGLRLRRLATVAAATSSGLQSSDSRTVLAWITLFVTGRSLQMVCNGQLSSVRLVQYGVPHGSVL